MAYPYRMTQKGIATLRRHNQAVAEAESIDFAADDAAKRAAMDADADAFAMSEASKAMDDEFPVFYRGKRL